MLNKSHALNPKIFKKDIETRSCRDGFGEALVEVGEKDDNVVVLSADLEDSTRVLDFKARFPERFYDVGVSEQALATVASGMAASGKIPFITSFAVFSPGRNWEQIRTTICLNDVPVKIISTHAGLNVGPDGATHQALEDIALMRTLPNMIVIAPSDAEETKKAVRAAHANAKPTYIRLPRYETPVYTTEKTPFTVGKSLILWEEKDPQVALIACGPLVYEALKAAKKLSDTGIASLVINCQTPKPLDSQTLIHSAKLAGCIVTIEDHQVCGGLGSAVSEVLSQSFPTPIEFVGVKDSFGESGTPRELFSKFGLTVQDIISAAKKAIRRKNQ